MDKQVADILDCAKQLLKESGANAFSMAKVAEASNVDFSYLQSHFKSKSLLLTALATSFLESHCAYLNTCQIERSRHVQQDLNQWLLSLLQYRESEGCDTIFKELWAIALHDQEVRLVLDQYYRQLQHITFNKLQSIVPESCSAQKIESASCFLLPFIEGYGLTRSTLPISLLLLSELLSKSLWIILLE